MPANTNPCCEPLPFGEHTWEEIQQHELVLQQAGCPRMGQRLDGSQIIGLTLAALICLWGLAIVAGRCLDKMRLAPMTAKKLGGI